MTPSIRPTVQRRRLRTELRRLRDRAGYTREQVASAMDWSLSKLIRIEAGTVSISTTDLRALLDHYAVPAGERRDELVALARLSRERMWWSTVKEQVTPHRLTYIGFEAEASEICYFSTTYLPGLFQTEPYTRAVIGGTDAQPRGAESLDAAVAVRRERQRHVLTGPGGPAISAVLDEAALRREVGGRPTMVAQLRHLLELASNPRVSIAVLPFSAGEHPGMGCPFVLFGFGEPEDDVAYLLAGSDEVLMQDAPGKVAELRRSFAGLRTLALGHPESMRFIEKVAAGMG